MNRNRKTLQGERGFTLMEVVVAVVILGLAYVAILQNFSLSIRNIIKVEQSRAENLKNLMAFDKEFYDIDEEEQELESGETYLSGSKYELIVVSSEDGKFTTLKLQKL